MKLEALKCHVSQSSVELTAAGIFEIGPWIFTWVIEFKD